MMVYLEGNVLHHGAGFLIVVQGGVGYRVLLPDVIGTGMRGQVMLYIHEVIRENERELFGFCSIDQLELFWRLINVSGVGPKIAQKLIFAFPSDELRTKIMSGDVGALTSVSGIGKKIAQKIILELKGALAEEETVSVFDTDAVDALMGLGYTRKDAEAAIAACEQGTTEELIRAALKGMGRTYER